MRPNAKQCLSNITTKVQFYGPMGVVSKKETGERNTPFKGQRHAPSSPIAHLSGFMDEVSAMLTRTWSRSADAPELMQSAKAARYTASIENTFAFFFARGCSEPSLKQLFRLL